MKITTLTVVLCIVSLVATFAQSSNSDWQQKWQQIAEMCPAKVSERVELLSVEIEAHSVTVTVRCMQMDKNRMTATELQSEKEEAVKLSEYLKTSSGMPSHTIVRVIGLDKAKRELFKTPF